MKHVPMRTCIVCRKQRDKSELVRIVKTPSGDIVLDASGHADGRGAYICADGDCMALAAKKKAFDRAFKTRVEPSVYAAIAEAYANPKER